MSQNNDRQLLPFTRNQTSKWQEFDLRHLVLSKAGKAEAHFLIYDVA
jgi:hypothetical protein